MIQCRDYWNLFKILLKKLEDEDLNDLCKGSYLKKNRTQMGLLLEDKENKRLLDLGELATG